MAELRLLWQNQTKDSVEKEVIERHLADILRRLGRVASVNRLDRLELELTLVGDPAITKLNQQFLGLNKPTDVLSFPSPARSYDLTELEESTNSLGSIVISVDTASRQATQAGINLADEVKTLAGHGFLHLLGYGHHWWILEGKPGWV